MAYRNDWFDRDRPGGAWKAERPSSPRRYWDPHAYDRDYYAADERGFGTRGLSGVGEYYGSENRPERPRGYGVVDMGGMGDMYIDDLHPNEIDNPGWSRREAGSQHRGRGPLSYRRSDERILEDVCVRLTDDAWVDATDIEIKVEGAEVQLWGTVHSRDEKRRAEALAEQIRGVRDVHNAIRIEPPR